MSARTCLGLVILALVCVAQAAALNPGTDVFIPAAARGPGNNNSFWMLDAYVFNPGTQTATVLVYWLERWGDNITPQSASFAIQPGETLVLADVINTTFGLDQAQGALRFVSTTSIVVSARSYNLRDGVTFGQGWEGIPVSVALGPDESTDIVGLVHNSRFRSNIMLIDAEGTGEGTIVNLTLRTLDGQQLAAAAFNLKTYEPVLYSIADLGVASFDDAVLHVEVTQGQAIVVASKIDNSQLSGDPTTLEAWTPIGAASSPDGVYQISIYDSDNYATGGSATFVNRELTGIDASYSNYDKMSGEDPSCLYTYRLEASFTPPLTLEQLDSGVEFTIVYPGSGEMTYSLSLELDDNLGLSGSVGAVGASFSADESGCNGIFPDLEIRGGKSAN